MKKTLQRLGIVTVGLSLCLWSCDKQDGIVKPSETTVSKEMPKIKEKIDFSVVDGRLKFETMEDFQGAMAKLTDFKEIKELEKKVGFTSMNEAYKEFYSQDVENSKKSERIISREFDDVVTITKDKFGKKNYGIALPFPALAGLVNKDGLVQIADKVLKISDEAVKIADVQYKEELEQSSLSSHVIVNKVNKHLGEIATSKSGKVLANWDNDTYIPYPVWNGYSARRWRVRKMFHDYNIGFDPIAFKSTYIFFYGVEVENQRDNWYGWGSVWLDGWESGSGSTNLNTQNVADPDEFTLLYLSSQSWGPSNGIQQHNTERIFLGTMGIFESDIAWGEYGIGVGGISTNMASHSFGRAEIKDPYNNESPIFSFYTYR
jgi:hypothetical protein